MLKLDGKPLNLHPTPPSVIKLREWLDGSPADELFSLKEVMTRIGISKDRVCRVVETMPEYTLMHKQKRYWGNPEAIAELRRRVNEAG